MCPAITLPHQPRLFGKLKEGVTHKYVGGSAIASRNQDSLTIALGEITVILLSDQLERHSTVLCSLRSMCLDCIISAMIWSASDGGVGLTIEYNAKGRNITASILISSDSLLTIEGAI